LEFAVESPQSGYLSADSTLKWNMEMLVSVGGDKPEYPEKNPQRMRTNNKLSPHTKPGPRTKPGPHWWEASLSPLHHPCSPNTVRELPLGIHYFLN